MVSRKNDTIKYFETERNNARYYHFKNRKFQEIKIRNANT